MDSILDPPGLPWGSLLAPKMLETCLEIPPGRPKSRSKDLFFGSKRRNTGFQKRGQKRDPLAGLRWVQDGMTGGRCGPGLSSFELEYACICAGSWKHAMLHRRWAADPKGHAAWHRRPTPFGPRLGRRDGIPERKLQDKALICLLAVSQNMCWTTFKNAFESLQIFLETHKMGVQI